MSRCSETKFCPVQTKYPSLVQEEIEQSDGMICTGAKMSRLEIISLLKRARKNYIACKANCSQETGLWGQQCIVLRKLLDGKRRVVDFENITTLEIVG